MRHPSVTPCLTGDIAGRSVWNWASTDEGRGSELFIRFWTVLDASYGSNFIWIRVTLAAQDIESGEHGQNR